MKVKLRCFDCNWKGQITVGIYDDVWLMMRKAHDLHNSEQKECLAQNPLSNNIFPVINEVKNMKKWHVNEVFDYDNELENTLDFIESKGLTVFSVNHIRNGTIDGDDSYPVFSVVYYETKTDADKQEVNDFGYPNPASVVRSIVENCKMNDVTAEFDKQVKKMEDEADSVTDWK